MRFITIVLLCKFHSDLSAVRLAWTQVPLVRSTRLPREWLDYHHLKATYLILATFVEWTNNNGSGFVLAIGSNTTWLDKCYEETSSLVILYYVFVLKSVWYLAHCLSSLSPLGRFYNIVVTFSRGFWFLIWGQVTIVIVKKTREILLKSAHCGCSFAIPSKLNAVVLILYAYNKWWPWLSIAASFSQISSLEFPSVQPFKRFRTMRRLSSCFMLFVEVTRHTTYHLSSEEYASMMPF